MGNKSGSGIRIGGVFDVVCRAPDGSIKWTEKGHNVVTNVGVEHILDVALSGASATATWYVGLKNTGSVAAGDTAASHSGWTENENYDEAARQTWTEAGVSSKSLTNSASPAVFTISTDSQTIAGAFIISDNTKGGTSGTLLCAADFSSSKSADDGDTLTVTYTFSGDDDGA